MSSKNFTYLGELKHARQYGSFEYACIQDENENLLDERLELNLEYEADPEPKDYFSKK